MRLLGAASYDPAGTVNKSLASAAAMAALDTTNLRVTFTAPDTGNVLVRLKAVLRGNTTGAVCFGVLDGATVKMRLAPFANRSQTGATTGRLNGVATAVITGLTPGQSYTWDFAFSVEFGVASSNLSYGGPDDTTAANAYGAASISIWEAKGLLASGAGVPAAILYDPAGAVTGLAVTTPTVMTAHDTTNLRITFICPPIGMVAVRQQFTMSGMTSFGEVLTGVLDGTTVRGRVLPRCGLVNVGAQNAADHYAVESFALVTGLTGGTSYTFDAALGVELAFTGGNVKYGGLNDTTNDNAWGGFAYDIWDPQEVGLLELGMAS